MSVPLEHPGVGVMVGRHESSLHLRHNDGHPGTNGFAASRSFGPSTWCVLPPRWGAASGSAIETSSQVISSNEQRGPLAPANFLSQVIRLPSSRSARAMYAAS